MYINIAVVLGREAELDRSAVKQRQARANMSIEGRQADAARKRHAQANMSPERRRAECDKHIGSQIILQKVE